MRFLGPALSLYLIFTNERLRELRAVVKKKVSLIVLNKEIETNSFETKKYTIPTKK